MSNSLTEYYTKATITTSPLALVVSNESGSNTHILPIDKTLDFNIVTGIPGRYIGTDLGNVSSEAPPYSIFKNSLTGDGYVKSPDGIWIHTYAPAQGNEYTIPTFTQGTTYSLGSVVNYLDYTFKSTIQNNTSDIYPKNVVALSDAIIEPYSITSAKLLQTDNYRLLGYNSNYLVDVNTITGDVVSTFHTGSSGDFNNTLITVDGYPLKSTGTTVTLGSIVGEHPTFTIGHIDFIHGSLYVHNLDDGWVYALKEGYSYFRKDFDLQKTVAVDFTMIEPSRCLFLYEGNISDSIDPTVSIYNVSTSIVSLISILNRLYLLNNDGTITSYTYTDSSWEILPLDSIANNSKCTDVLVTVPIATDKISVSSNVVSSDTASDITSADATSVYILYTGVGSSRIDVVNPITGAVTSSYTIAQTYTAIDYYKGRIFLQRDSTIIDAYSLLLVIETSFSMATRIAGSILQLQTLGNTLYVYTSLETIYAFDEPYSSIYENAVTLTYISGSSRVYPMHSTYILQANFSSDTEEVFEASLVDGKVLGLSGISIASDEIFCYTRFGTFLLNTASGLLQLHPIEQVKRLI